MKQNKKPEQLYRRKQEPTVAPGLEDDEFQRPASQEEQQAGDTTMVYRLSFDENDNGSDD